MVQLVHAGYRQINILESKKDVVRGGHYHKHSSEVFYVADGCLNVTFRKDAEQEHVRFQKGDFFLIKPGVIHSLSFCEDCLLIALYDVPIERDDGTKDIYSEKD